MIVIDFAVDADWAYLRANDTHLSEAMLKRKINDREILVAKHRGRPIGWLRWGYFWDEVPFMNMLAIEEEYRRQGFGRNLVTHWENLMRDAGHTRLMTSTLADESAQFFYRKLSYNDAGALLLEGEALEILFTKSLN